MDKFGNTSKQLDAIFDRVSELSRVQRIMICVGVFLIIFILFWFLSYWPRWQSIGKLDAEYKRLTAELTRSKKNAQQLEGLRKEFDSKQREFNLVMKSLPEKEEISSLLTGVSKSGQQSGLEFLLFQPQGDVNKNFYAEIPVSIRVKGGYHNVAQFFDKVANLSRIVNIRNIQISRDKAGSLTTACEAVTYKFIEPTPAKANAEEKKLKKQ
ncbi:MAG: type 4a pilus biogenesis protein PilO [Desulfobacterales bacterium]|jgi:type IV pilus assembly protein PilO